MRHLKGLLAAAASAAVGFSCSSSQDPVVCDPLPPPAETDAGADDGTGQGGDAGGPADDPEDPVVCDPLPPPYEEEPQD